MGGHSCHPIIYNNAFLRAFSFLPQLRHPAKVKQLQAGASSSKKHKGNEEETYQGWGDVQVVHDESPHSGRASQVGPEHMFKSQAVKVLDMENIITLPEGDSVEVDVVKQGEKPKHTPKGAQPQVYKAMGEE